MADQNQNNNNQNPDDASQNADAAPQDAGAEIKGPESAQQQQPSESNEAAAAQPGRAATAPAPAPPQPPAPPKPGDMPGPQAPGARSPRTKPTGGNWWWGTGRRKASVARVRVRPGNGQFIVNNRKFDEYFTELRDHKDLMNVLEKTNTVGQIDVKVRVHGGGYTGQAGAILLGLGRALNQYDPSLESILRDNDFLTRDPRRVERKKYGQPGARKRFQFSKR